MRRNADATPPTLIERKPSAQPELPDSISWPEATREWWEMWGSAPMAKDFLATDWSFLLDTALLHASVWGSANFAALAELRLRVAKFGATPEDRARLRMQFAEPGAPADDAPRKAASASSRYTSVSPLRAV